MTTTVKRSSAGFDTASPPPTRWGLPHMLAVVGGLISLYLAWTFTAWILDGPAPVTAFEDRSSTSWVAARVFEALYVLMSVAVLAFVIRGCRRAKRFTLDAMFIVAGFATLGLDPLVNFFGPYFMYSSNWINLNTWCGYAPGIVNPDCSRMPEPVGNFLIYTFGFLGFTLLLNGALTLMKRRNPSLTTKQLIWATIAVSLAIEIPFEGMMAWLWIWVYPGSPEWMSISGDVHRLPWLEVIGGLVLFVGMSSVRFFKDDRGRSFVERGLDHLSPTRQRVISTLALCGYIQLLLIFDIICVSIAGLYASPYPKQPDYIVNEMCDAHGVTGTAYGPCPGSPNFRLPIRSLPDRS